MGSEPPRPLQPSDRLALGCTRLCMLSEARNFMSIPKITKLRLCRVAVLSCSPVVVISEQKFESWGLPPCVTVGMVQRQQPGLPWLPSSHACLVPSRLWEAQKKSVQVVSWRVRERRSPVGKRSEHLNLCKVVKGLLWQGESGLGAGAGHHHPPSAKILN